MYVMLMEIFLDSKENIFKIYEEKVTVTQVLADLRRLGRGERRRLGAGWREERGRLGAVERERRRLGKLPVTHRPIPIAR